MKTKEREKIEQEIYKKYKDCYLPIKDEESSIRPLYIYAPGIHILNIGTSLLSAFKGITEFAIH